MGDTPRGYPYPGGSEAPNGPFAFQALAEAVDDDVQGLHDGRTKRLGYAGPGTAGVLLGGDLDWIDLATVSAASRGLVCEANFKINYYNNGNSGTWLIVVCRVVVDDVQVGPTIHADAPYRPGDMPHYTAAFDVQSTPAAGAHVWKLQAYATTYNTAQVRAASLTVTEWAA